MKKMASLLRREDLFTEFMLTFARICLMFFGKFAVFSSKEKVEIQFFYC